MERIFAQIVSLSLSAGWLVLAVLLIRPLLRRAPRRIVCLLWALVALRLVCPAQIEWRASLVPAQETVAQTAQTTFARPATPVAVGAQPAPATTAPAPEAPAPRLTETLSYVWLGGVIAMLLWAAVSDVRLRLRLRGAVREQENIWRCEGIDSPFVLGVFRPRICLPPELSGEQLGYVLAHERGHIARRDHVWKPLGWLLLCVYWFHPLLWLAYALLCRDLELACDERVARGLDRAGIADYAETLLACGCRRRHAPMSPVAFGELSVKARVKAVLRYRKPVFLRVAAALVIVAAVGAFFLTERPAEALELAKKSALGAYTGAVPPGFADYVPPSPPPKPEETPAYDAAAYPQTGTNPATTYDTAGDDAFERMMEEYNARMREEAAIHYGSSGSTSSLDTYSNPNATSQTTTRPYGPQSALNVQPSTPHVITADELMPNTQVGVVQNGDTYAIRLSP